MSVASPRAPARTEVFDLPIGVPCTQSPYWHRPQPLLAVIHLDPDHQALRAQFPAGWAHLVRVKVLLDGVAALEAPRVVSDVLHLKRIAPLLGAAAAELLSFAATERGEQAATVVAQAQVAADRLAHYARSLEWKPTTLTEPVAGHPWLYCGPLSSWAMHSSRSRIAFLVAKPNPAMQREIEAVDRRLPEIRATVGQILGGQARSVTPTAPTMRIADLLLAGGESQAGHKNFAHFFPLEAPGSSVRGADFTVVFANVHAARLDRCSLRLLDRFTPPAVPGGRRQIAATSLRWFRGHDLAHFWRRSTVEDNGRPVPSLTPFERMILEEAYADVLGLLSCGALAAGPSLEQAFLAELLRYLSRRHDHFADTSAAALEVGWLIERGLRLPPDDGRWLDAATPLLAELAGCLHRVRWQADPADLGTLRTALATGVCFQADLAELYRQLPTDLAYTFG